MITDPSNINFQIAADFINYTNCSVFLTGKAGTGKTTFLKYIKTNTNKQLAVVAPTGVAAINAGGVTIHSFFQLPFTPFVPHLKGFSNEEALDKHQLISRSKISKERKKILQQLELLIIDEISMVRADVLDAIDTVLKHFRNNAQQPFGGVQVLYIGDLFQLPPVVKDNEWLLLAPHYASPFFFSSQVIQEKKPAYVQLEKIYRQKDEHFIEILNQVRNNQLNTWGNQLLHQQYQPNFEPPLHDTFITLTTHNNKADAINAIAIEKLTTPTFTFKAVVENDFTEKIYPADEILHLKLGSQVMFLKNDIDKKYFNGKIGIIESIDDENISVLCKDETQPIKVEKYTWENIRYTLNKQTQKVEEEVVGTFTQYPLRLAWAITIHKSQGLTFEKAMIDAGQAFAAGQVYVALSRCTTLSGIVLTSKITSKSLSTDQRIVDYAAQQQSTPLPIALQREKHEYQTTLLLQLFNLEKINTDANQLQVNIQLVASSFNPETLPFLQHLQQLIKQVNEVAIKFEIQLKQLFDAHTTPENNEPLQLRIKKAAEYFNSQLAMILNVIQTSPASTDSKQHATLYNEMLLQLFHSILQQKNAIASCINGFNITTYQQQKSALVLPKLNINAYAATSNNININMPHAALFKQLKQLRDGLCKKNNLAIYLIANTQTLQELTTYLPQNVAELKQISGFGEAKIEKYGLLFLDIIQRYCNEQGLISSIHEKAAKRVRKEKNATTQTNTKEVSFNLYNEGKTIAEIAATRGFSVGTIQGHLVHYIALGLIPVEDLLSATKIKLIQSSLAEFDTTLGLGLLKEKLGQDISYGEIKMVMASMKLTAKES